MSIYPPSEVARVICFHGFPGHPTDWGSLAEALGKSYELFSVPMPWLRSVEANELSLQQIINYCAVIVDEYAQGTTHIIGHDLGGLACWWLGQSKLKSRITSLSIISCPHPAAYRSFAASPEYKSQESYRNAIFDSPETLGGRIRDKAPLARDQIALGLAETAIERLRPMYRQIEATAQTSDQRLPALPKMPVSLISNRDDHAIGPSTVTDTAALFERAIPHLQLEDPGHFPHLVQTKHVANFLREFWNDKTQ